MVFETYGKKRRESNASPRRRSNAGARKQKKNAYVTEMKFSGLGSRERTLGVGDVAPQVLLQISVLVVVDADESVTRACREVLNQRGFAGRRGPLKQNRVPP